MPDRIIRDDLLRSARFCKLPSDTDRMAYLVIRIRSDDFGNIEGGLWNVYRLLAECTTIKTEEITATVLNHLSDADLIRVYKVEEREYIHCPRSRPQNSYLVRKCPPSPWCDPDAKLGKHVRSVRNQGHAKNLPVTLQEHHRDVLQGVGVGVGVGEKKNKNTAAPSKKRSAPFVLPDWLEKDQDVWQAWIEARTKAKHPPTDWAKHLAVAKLESMRDDGHNVRGLLAEAAFHNWQSFYPKEQKA